jgi:hypothetical protein
VRVFTGIKTATEQVSTKLNNQLVTRNELSLVFRYRKNKYLRSLLRSLSTIVNCEAFMALPSAVSSLLSSAPAIGFSGSRSSVPRACGFVAAVVPAGVPVFVGCASGVDEFFRGAFPSARVFSVASFGSGRGAFAARSVAVVRAVESAGGVWVSFPSGPCPSGLAPSASSSRAFCGAGSGSWASLAFAVGLGLPCLVGGFAPPAVWGFSSLGCGWWFRCAPVPAGVQLSLF